MVVRPLPSLYNYQGLCTITILLYIISIFPLAVVYCWSPRVERIRLYPVVSKVTTAQILHTTYYHTLRNSVLEGTDHLTPGLYHESVCPKVPLTRLHAIQDRCQQQTAWWIKRASEYCVCCGFIDLHGINETGSNRRFTVTC